MLASDTPDIRTNRDTLLRTGTGGIRIGEFQLFPDRALLLRGDEAVRIGSRALSLLIALVQSGGEVVSKELLMKKVWPDTFVEEANLRVNIATLRRLLGDTSNPPRCIVNVSGRGYRFVAPLDPLPLREKAGHEPSGLTRLIGRRDEVNSLLECVVQRRLVTIAGPGGTGKTSVALALLEQLQETFEDGTATVDLAASAAGDDNVAQSVAMVLQLSLPAADPMVALSTYLEDKNMLLVLDNCEHVIGGVATLAEYLLKRSPHLHILATSTEPMGAEGEWVFRLSSFDVPLPVSDMSASESLSVPAIELFVERARATSANYHYLDSDVAVVADICRKLDGNALAIEIAAASVAFFSTQDLAANLDDRFELLVRGRRNVAPRQQTLRGLLEWSYERLSESEKRTLRRISVFRAAFRLDAARTVVGSGAYALTVVNDIASLVRKSLLEVNFAETHTTYRLMESTRSYARERAAAALELEELARLHAAHFSSLLERAEIEWTRMSRSEWVRSYGPMIDDARAAADWALSGNGDIGLGLRLTLLLLPLVMQYGLIEEVRDRIVVALSKAPDAKPRDIIAEIRLNTAYSSVAQTQEASFSNADPWLKRAMELADEVGEAGRRVAPLMMLTTHSLARGDYQVGFRYAEATTEALAGSTDELAQLAADRVLAQAANYNGDNVLARTVANRVLAHPARNIPLIYGSFQIDRLVTMRVVIARSLWLQGFANQAKTVALEALSLAREDGPFALPLTLSFAVCPIAIWSGLDEEAEDLTNELSDHAERFTLGTWKAWASVFNLVLARRRGDRPAPFQPDLTLQADALATFDEELASPATLERGKLGLGGWANPELLRIAAVQILTTNQLDREAAAASMLSISIEQARSQSALAWELRSAITLAELLRGQGRKEVGLKELEGVYDRLTEGFGTADALRAKDLIEELSRS